MNPSSLKSLLSGILLSLPHKNFSVFFLTKPNVFNILIVEKSITLCFVFAPSLLLSHRMSVINSSLEATGELGKAVMTEVFIALSLREIANSLTAAGT